MPAERHNPYNPFVEQAVLRIQEREARERIAKATGWTTVCKGPARPKLLLVPQDSKQIRGKRKNNQPAPSSVKPTLQELLHTAVEQRWLFSGFRIQARKLGAGDEEIKRLWLNRIKL